MFKDADKNLIKLMNTKESKFESSLDQYLDQYLLPGLYKISGIKNESYLFESDENIDTEIDKTQKEIKEKENKEGKKEEENIPEEYRDKVIQSTKGWITNILSPILKIKNPKTKDNKNKNEIIPTKDSEVRRDVVQDMIKNSKLDDIKNFRELVAKNLNINNEEDKISRFPLGKK